eukprot:6175883-Pleurochrysis_carterae.AAC.1
MMRAKTKLRRFLHSLFFEQHARQMAHCIVSCILSAACSAQRGGWRAGGADISNLRVLKVSTSIILTLSGLHKSFASAKENFCKLLLQRNHLFAQSWSNSSTVVAANNSLLAAIVQCNGPAANSAADATRLSLSQTATANADSISLSAGSGGVAVQDLPAGKGFQTYVERMGEAGQQKPNAGGLATSRSAVHTDLHPASNNHTTCGLLQTRCKDAGAFAPAAARRTEWSLRCETQCAFSQETSAHTAVKSRRAKHAPLRAWSPTRLAALFLVLVACGTSAQVTSKQWRFVFTRNGGPVDGG